MIWRFDLHRFVWDTQWTTIVSIFQIIHTTVICIKKIDERNERKNETNEKKTQFYCSNGMLVPFFHPFLPASYMVFKTKSRMKFRFTCVHFFFSHSLFVSFFVWCCNHFFPSSTSWSSCLENFRYLCFVFFYKSIQFFFSFSSSFAVFGRIFNSYTLS